MELLRRDFLKYCAGSAALVGLEFSPFGGIKRAIATLNATVPVTYPISRSYISAPYSTLTQTVVPNWSTLTNPFPKDFHPSDLALYPTYGFGNWAGGGGLAYQLPDLATGKVTGPSTELPSQGTPLLAFFTISDIHICDKQSPARCIGYSYNYPDLLSTMTENGQQVPYPLGNTSSYSGIILYTPHVLDAAIQTINALHQKTPFDFGISLGDATDNTQYNELRWYIDVIDGKLITPSSGSTAGANIDYQAPFQATGLDKSIKWYQAIGNHDQFWMGSCAVTDQIRQALVGSEVLNLGLLQSLPPTPAVWAEAFKDGGYYMGVVDGSTEYGEIIKTGPEGDFSTPPQVIADAERRSLSMQEWMNEFFDTISEPVGHGFTTDMVQQGFACYSFTPVSDIPVKVIVLDDTDKLGSGAAGALDETRFNWLVNELEAGQNADQLMIVCAHIPVNPYLDKPMGNDGTDLSYYPIWPYGISVPLPPGNISQTTLLETLKSYSNLVMWVSGHVHRNTITPQPSTFNPEYGFWEVETPSLRDFPQQFRRFQISINSGGNISIFTDDVDTAPNSGSPASKSRTYAIGGFQIFQDGWNVDQNGQLVTIPTGLPYNTGGSVQQGPGMDPATGVYNAELVISMSQLSAGLQTKLQNLQPVVGTFKITGNGGPFLTLDHTVLGSTPVAFMASESPSFSGASWTTYAGAGVTWTPFEPCAVAFTLKSNPGNKTVYFKVKNSTGVESAVVEASISVDDYGIFGDGWMWLSWFGDFDAGPSPWIYHLSLGWLYPCGSAADGIWFWDPGMNSFWWTNASDYPYVYRASDGAWLWYEKDSSNPRRFYNVTTGKWEDH